MTPHTFPCCGSRRVLSTPAALITARVLHVCEESK